MRQTRFILSPDRLIMVQATIHALDDNKHVTVGYTGVISLELFNPSYWEQDPAEVARIGLEKMQAVIDS